MCFGPFGLQDHHPFQAIEAGFQLAALLQDDAQIIPCRRQLGVQRHGALSGLFSFRQPTFLAAHFSQVAEINRRRARRLAGLAQMRDSQIQIAVGVRHHPQQLQSIGLARPCRQHPLA